MELYELDLGSRTPPIYRLTEKPSRHDTEVTYMDDRPVDPRVAEFADVDTDDWQ